MKRIYLDDAATTRIDPRVWEAMEEYGKDKYGNPSSSYSEGIEVKKAMDEARRQVAKLINAHRDEIIFTSGGTESDNLAIKGVAFNSKKGHIITTKIEHPAVYETCEYLIKKGFEVTFLDVDYQGFVDPSEFESAIKDNTVLASIMYANNEIGTIEPIKELAKISKENGIIFHTDAVQAVGKIEIDVKKEYIDMLSLSGHKLHGPKGIGALYMKRDIELEPLIHGGGHEYGLRSGTENTLGIVGIGKACSIAREEMKADSNRMQKLRDGLIDGLLSQVSEISLNGPRENRLPNNANFHIKGVDGDALILQLDSHGIAASTGSACSTKEVTPSRVLRSIGLSEEEAFHSLRLTLGKFTSKEDIEKALKTIPQVVSNLREMCMYSH